MALSTAINPRGYIIPIKQTFQLKGKQVVNWLKIRKYQHFSTCILTERSGVFVVYAQFFQAPVER